jgi:ABC-2 type transport system ATP-binding protein
MHKPKLLLLDEPTAGVDPKARREFWDEIHRLAAGGLTVLVSTHYMDEAERCHRISYIAYGKLIATGTVADVVRDAGLTTFVVEGKRIDALAAELRTMPGVEQVAPFGNTLHVVGGAGERCHRTALCSETSLEDVFIQFMYRTTAWAWEKPSPHRLGASGRNQPERWPEGPVRG